MKKANWNSESSSSPNSTPSNPMASHVLWMIPPLLKVCILPWEIGHVVFPLVSGRRGTIRFKAYVLKVLIWIASS